MRVPGTLEIQNRGKTLQILFILAGNDDIHKSLDEFEIRPDPIRDHTELAALEHIKNLMLLLFLVSQLCLYLGNSQVSVYRTIGPLVIHGLKICMWIG